MHLHRLVLMTLTSIALSCLPSAAQAPQSWAQVGALTCTATLTPAPPQYYDGAINTVGIDVGVSAGSVLAWGVFAPTSGVPQGALAGEYVGASGDLGIGVGAGANVLLGGSARTFALQPISLEGSIAVNVALGVSGLKLRPVL